MTLSIFCQLGLSRFSVTEIKPACPAAHAVASLQQLQRFSVTMSNSSLYRLQDKPQQQAWPRFATCAWLPGATLGGKIRAGSTK